MKHATIKVNWSDNVSLSKTLSKIKQSILKGELRNSIKAGNTSGSFEVSEIEIEKEERQVRFEQINGVNYIVIKSKV